MKHKHKFTGKPYYLRAKHFKGWWRNCEIYLEDCKRFCGVGHNFGNKKQGTSKPKQGDIGYPF